MLAGVTKREGIQGGAMFPVAEDGKGTGERKRYAVIINHKRTT